ncbi:hypothetical protein CCR85_09840 [Rhodothalassium salexigens]|uniref:efflux RND transporter permease subunit n=1 Tax=Rhodothalassium salexigens TaxID=1086 RepID=UPI0019136B60|nr:efflux RND transporter permease subunit [Rhodothalassium salexigens]MBK5911787.1 hypothetical protein [Rhodothalassium salexigens]
MTERETGRQDAAAADRQTAAGDGDGEPPRGAIAALVRAAIAARTTTVFAIVVVALGGLLSFFQLGRLEDPTFTIKTALVLTPYPGATPEEVEREVSEKIALAVQELPELRYVQSTNRAGLSMVKVDIQERFRGTDMPQIWDKLRKRMRDVAGDLPPGAGPPVVRDDDFGEVYGHVLALTGDGFDRAALEDRGEDIKRALSLIDGVSRVELWGVQRKAIYVDVSDARIRSLGLSAETVLQTLATQNAVVDAGALDARSGRLRVEVAGAFDSPEDIENLILRPSPRDLQQTPGARAGLDTVRLGDVARVSLGYVEPPLSLMRHNGLPAIAIAVSNQADANVVDLGERLGAAVDRLNANLPVGLELHRVAWQADLVDDAVSGFLWSLAQSVAIVTVVLTLAMGWRMGAIISSALVLSILGTLIVMGLWDIDLHRVSLGAMVVALGMIVDNAIVVSENIAVRLDRGMGRFEASVRATVSNAWPLLGATVIAVLSFYPVYAAPSNVGEFCAALFQVIAVSLLLSWVLSITFTPLQSMGLLRATPATAGRSPGDTRLTRAFDATLRAALARRWAVLAAMVVAFAGSVYGFAQVERNFFPFASRPQFTIHYWAEEAQTLAQVEANLAPLAERARAHPDVTGVSTFLGRGAPRFYLPVEPEPLNPSYGQLLVNVSSRTALDRAYTDIKAWARANIPGIVLVKRYTVGPGNTWQFEGRFTGPADADVAVLKALAAEAQDILRASPLTEDVRTDWRHPVPKLVARYDQKQARWSGVTRDDVASSLRRSHDGVPVGLYRDGDDLLPILARKDGRNGETLDTLGALSVRPTFSTATVPLDQVTDGLDLAFEAPVIQRFDRRRAITVQTNPVDGVTFPSLWASVRDRIEAIDLPPGYAFELDGEYESATTAQRSLVPGLVPAGAAMLLIIVALFNALRPMLIIVAAIPFALIGITAGLLATGAAFGFMALLGALSLTGMMIKNAVVLIDQIRANRRDGQDAHEALVDAAKLRLRPVLLAASTTILGMTPLLSDPFWVSMAITIMAGLAVGTLITMVFVPVVYALAHNIQPPAR